MEDWVLELEGGAVVAIEKPSSQSSGLQRHTQSEELVICVESWVGVVVIFRAVNACRDRGTMTPCDMHAGQESTA